MSCEEWKCEGWKTVKLGDVCIDGRGKYGIPASAIPFSPDEYTYLRITDITDDGKINKEGLVSVKDPKAKNYLLRPNDIVFARTGGSTGRNYFYDGTDGEFVYAGFLIKFSINKSVVNPQYIKYYCQSKEYKNWVNSFNTGSTRGNINAQTYSNMELPLPPIRQQDLLVSVLSTLDDKIELNNKINKNLEEMAQAIFKSWFVDFEPFKEGEFVDSELGRIPKGWRVGSIYEYLNVIYGAPYKSNLFNNLHLGFPLIRIRDLKTFSPQLFTEESLPRQEFVYPGDIIAGMDAEFIPCVWRGNKGLLNQRVCKIKPKHSGICPYYGLLLIEPEFKYIQSYKVGTTVCHLGKSDIDRIKVILPPEEKVLKYSNIIYPLYKQMVVYSKENTLLAQLRDTLLPKLMSGEIRVSVEVK